MKNQNSLNIVLVIFTFIVIGCGCPNNNSTSTVINKDSANIVSNIPTPTPAPLTFEELKAKTEKLLVFSKDEYSKSDITQFDEALTPLRAIPKTDKNYKQAQVLLKKLIDKSSVIAAEVLVLGDKPVQSKYDGRVTPVTSYLRANLNDYDSSEFVEWSPIAKVYEGKEPYWVIRLKLRAKNGFGAYIVRDTYYYIRNNQVVKTKGI